jgi:broad specificity phosphatase PhoE
VASADLAGGIPAGRIVLIRHGETEWSRSGQHTGRTDIPLTPDGERWAAALRPVLAEFRFALVATSPRSRAVRTADLAGLSPAGVGAAEGGRPPAATVVAREIWSDLAEWDYGDLEGLTTPQIRANQPDWTIWAGRVPGGENAGQVAARADAVLARASALLPTGDVALVGHGHMSRVLAARWIGLGPEHGASFLVEPASLTVLGHERDTRVLSRLNERPAAVVAPTVASNAAATH